MLVSICAIRHVHVSIINGRGSVCDQLQLHLLACSTLYLESRKCAICQKSGIDGVRCRTDENRIIRQLILNRRHSGCKCLGPFIFSQVSALIGTYHACKNNTVYGQYVHSSLPNIDV